MRPLDIWQECLYCIHLIFILNWLELMDLSQIFKNKTQVASPSRLSLSSMSSTRNSSSPRQDWGLDHLESNMRKGVKKQVSEQSMSEQLKIFYNTQKDIFINKSIIIAISTFLLIYLTGIQGPIAFTGIMLAAVQLVFKLAIPASMKGILDNVKAIQPLIYCSIFYSLLKWVAGVNNGVIHWPMTVVSILATFAHVIVKMFEPYVLIYSSKLIGDVVVEKKAVKKLIEFWKFEMEKVKTIKKMATFFMLVLSLLSIAFLGILMYFGLLSIQYFQMRYFLSSIFVFLSLQIYLDFITYINLTFSHDLKILRIMLDKLPIYLNLLRLKKQPSNQLIHIDCLKYLFIKISDVRYFLSTETFKSLLYTTYMDIFNQYASLELERLNFDLMTSIAKVKVNDSIVRSEKSMLQDLLIYFRKFYSFVGSEWEVSKMVKEISNLNYLFLVINKINGDIQNKEGKNQQSRNEQAKISSRVINLLSAIRKRLEECSSSSSLTAYTRKQIESSKQIIISTAPNVE